MSPQPSGADKQRRRPKLCWKISRCSSNNLTSVLNLTPRRPSLTTFAQPFDAGGWGSLVATDQSEGFWALHLPLLEDGPVGRGDDMAPTTSMVRLPRQLWSVLKIDSLEISRGVTLVGVLSQSLFQNMFHMMLEKLLRRQ